MEVVGVLGDKFVAPMIDSSTLIPESVVNDSLDTLESLFTPWTEGA